MRTETGIFGGSGSIIQDNVIIRHRANWYYWGQYDNDINSNVIQRSCFSFNDCRAIYVDLELTENSDQEQPDSRSTWRHWMALQMALVKIADRHLS